MRPLFFASRTLLRSLKPIPTPLRHFQVRGLTSEATAVPKPISTSADVTTPAPEPVSKGEVSPSVVTVSKSSIVLNVDGEIARHELYYLRDCCRCPKCVDPSTSQKLFSTASIPEHLGVQEAKAENGGLRIKWRHDIEDGHESFFSREWLRDAVKAETRNRDRWNNIPKTLWNKEIMERDVEFFGYEDYMKNDEVLYKVLLKLEQYGLVFLKDVPEDEQSVATIAERIGNLKRTFYGDTWNVKSVANSKNIAYTSLFLGLHMDLLYFESPPGIQLLHCLKNKATGGDSIFSDSFHAATTMKALSARYYNNLTNIPITFHYDNDGQHYHFQRPVIAEKYSPYTDGLEIDHVNWAPPFQGPFDYKLFDKDLPFRQWVQAAREFQKMVEDEKNVFRLRMQEGYCMLFANRRVLHGREAFDAESGDRWYKGAYLDIDAYRSKLRVLSKQFNNKE